MSAGDGELMEVSMVTEVVGEPQKEALSEAMSTVEVAMETVGEESTSVEVAQQKRWAFVSSYYCIIRVIEYQKLLINPFSSAVWAWLRKRVWQIKV